MLLTPEKLQRLGLQNETTVSEEQLTRALIEANIRLNDADNIFYLPIVEQELLVASLDAQETRQLTASDQEVFDEFISRAPENDVDEAYVELDHWLVYGTFVNGVLGAAASMYPWTGSKLADLGVITLPDYRFQGLAKKIVRAISAEALRRGYEPQYRCQLENSASVAVAMGAGFEHFGRWEVLLGNS